MLLGFNLAVYIRSVFIPSSATRMALLGGIASLPLIIYSFSTMPLRYAFWTIPWSLSGVSVATLGAWVIYGLRREAAHARRLGQYTLEQKLGEGGMGVVYRASHAMLRRPTAVKLLRLREGRRAGVASLRARGSADGRAEPSKHRVDLRLRSHARRRLLLRDGVPRRHRPAAPGRRGRRSAPGAGGPHPAPGARRPRRSAQRGTDPP